MRLHGENSQKDQAEGRWYYLKVKMRKLEKTRKASAKSAIQIDNLYLVTMVNIPNKCFHVKH
jgi:hypothetical protein